MSLSAGNPKSRWEVVASAAALLSVNPIRRIVDELRVEPHPDKKVIALSIGDPTIFGNIKPAPETIEAIRESLESYNYNGYAPTVGYGRSREAVAEYSKFSNEDGVECNIDPEDVLLCSGCSHGLEMCITTLASPGQNILVPRPGFSIYKTLAEGSGIQIKYYDLLEDQQWRVNLTDLENEIDEKTSAIIVTNPSNPCGSVYSKEHLKSIIDVASRNCLPIIADEIYEHLVFPGNEYFPMASLSEDVPILSCSGTTKRFLVPGWRMGWIIIHDRNDLFLSGGVKEGLKNLSQRIIGSNTIIQGALPSILQNTPQQFHTDVINLIHRHAKLAYESLLKVKGLKPIMPQGAMYMIVGINFDLFPGIKDDMDFVEKLMGEQSVFCLPGKCFNYENIIRIVLTLPDDMLKEACRRIADFCENHILLDNMKTFRYSLIEDVNVIDHDTSMNSRIK